MEGTIILLLVLLCFSCNQKAPSEDAVTGNGGTTKEVVQSNLSTGPGYRLTEPDETYILPGSLEEISGMQFISNSLIACVEDERGIVYFYDMDQQQVVRQVKWGKKGDYEGIAGNESVLYILESNGNIYQLRDYMGESAPVVQKWKSGLDKDCDAEGLYLLEDGKTLLIACKEGEGGVSNIWSFDVEKKALAAQPYLQIQHQLIEEKFLETGIDRFSLEIRKLFDKKGDSGVLAPSGISVHPITAEIYILSSRSKLMVVVTPSGEVKHIIELPVSRFLQPESITFTTEGHLLIGNEGRGGKPKIFLFKYDI